MHSFEVHLNESACRKKVRLGLEQVITIANYRNAVNQQLPGGETKKTRCNINENNMGWGRGVHGG